MRYAAFFRAVNVGGNVVRMAELREQIEKLGFTNVGTILQSGTAVLDSPDKASQIETRLESGLAASLKLQTTVAVRSRSAIKTIVSENPFAAEAASDPARLVVLIFKSPVKPKDVAALEAAVPGRERIALGDGVLYAYYPDGQGESKLTAAFMDRRLGTTVTARNWNTMLKIAAALSSVV